MILLLIISLVLLIFISVTDFRTRQIPVILLVAELLFSILIGYLILGRLLSKTIAVNLFIVGFQTFILWLWFKIRARNSGSLLWSKFGKGDLFMLTIAAINFSPMNYLFFILLVCIVSLIIRAGYFIFQRSSFQTIPFAGYLATGLILCRIFQILGISRFFYADSFHTNFIHGIH